MGIVKEKSNVKNKSKDQIIREHMDLVHKIARNYNQMITHHYDDLVQQGLIGLLNAIDRYDPKHKASFRTYAAHLIASEIRHYLRDQLPMVRPPRELQELLPKVRKIEQLLTFQYGREATEEEIALALDISLDKLWEVRGLEKKLLHISLDQTLNLNGDSNVSVLEQLEDKERRSFQLVQEDRILLTDAMKNIREQSRQVLEFAFYNDLTQTEIAKHLGISQMQVSRRLRSALHELWKTLSTRVTPW